MGGVGVMSIADALKLEQMQRKAIDAQIKKIDKRKRNQEEDDDEEEEEEDDEDEDDEDEDEESEDEGRVIIFFNITFYYFSYDEQ